MPTNQSSLHVSNKIYKWINVDKASGFKWLMIPSRINVKLCLYCFYIYNISSLHLWQETEILTYLLQL